MSDTFVRRAPKFADFITAQLGMLLMIVVGIGGILFFSLFAPTFFPFGQYLGFRDTFWEDVLRFWPAFAWCGGMSLLRVVSGRIRSTIDDERHLTQGVVTSIGAGVLEELLFRCVAIFYAMVLLVVFNFVLSIGGWVAAVAISLAGLICFVGMFLRNFYDNLGQGFAGGILLPLLAAGLVYVIFRFNHDPVYMVYEHLFYPIINFVTFGLMKSVLPGDHLPLLVMGMVFANFWFRDGHKYQGLFGWCNSWFLGCVFIFATLSYGLFVAIAVHAIYDPLIDGIRYFGRKIWGRRYPQVTYREVE